MNFNQNPYPYSSIYFKSSGPTLVSATGLDVSPESTIYLVPSTQGISGGVVGGVVIEGGVVMLGGTVVSNGGGVGVGVGVGVDIEGGGVGTGGWGLGSLYGL